MTRRMTVIVCAMLSFMLLFITVGYAALTVDLAVKGEVKVHIPSGLFITDISKKSESGLDVRDVSYVKNSTTVECGLSKSSNNTAGSVTYEITVLNNTELEYAYRGLYYQSSLEGYHNAYVSTSNSNTKIGVVTSFPNGRVVGPGEYLTFTVTYTLGSSRNMFPSRNTYTTLLNYQFGINVETEAEAREAVHEKFVDILNTSSTYEELIDNLDNKFDGSQEWTSNYIGNVGDATTDDSVAVNTLFAGQLQMVIDGKTTPARVLVKHENLDDNTMTGDDYVAVNEENGGVFRGYGCEMTLYLTTDDLSQRNGTAPVYVSVFTCDRDENGNIISGWYRIGDTYVGTAPIVGYKGEEGGTGSFITDDWVADAATYSPTSKYSYRVSQGTTIKALVQAVDVEAIDTLQGLLDRAKAMIDDTTYAGTGITIVEEAYAATAPYYTLDAAGNPIAKANITRAQLCPVISILEAELDKAQEEIDKILGGG